ncbi:MAG: GPW/gp25 family protein [Spirochaetaceae bacterium]|jgi:type VI secretion system protein ImpF|nr:GPW/gp25 family protein [Spirochaetaceae bacterium]
MESGGIRDDIRKEDARYKPYVLRRLVDTEPYEKTERVQNVITEKQVKDDIFRNIEMLFYSRSHPSLKEFKDYEDVANSVLGYGIYDYCGKVCTSADREELVEQIKKQLRIFEPRLAPDSIKVEFGSIESSMRSMLELRISGLIVVGQVNEEVLFISRLDLETGNATLTNVG